MACHEVLRKHFAALELSCRARGAERTKTARCEDIDEPGVERSFGSDDGQADAFAFREIGEGGNIVRLDWHEAGDGRNSGVAWSTQQFARAAFAREFPSECMLAATAADNE